MLWSESLEGGVITVEDPGEGFNLENEKLIREHYEANLVERESCRIDFEPPNRRFIGLKCMDADNGVIVGFERIENGRGFKSGETGFRVINLYK